MQPGQPWRDAPNGGASQRWSTATPGLTYSRPAYSYTQPANQAGHPPAAAAQPGYQAPAAGNPYPVQAGVQASAGGQLPWGASQQQPQQQPPQQQQPQGQPHQQQRPPYQNVSYQGGQEQPSQGAASNQTTVKVYTTDNPCKWTGVVTQLIPPNYGIVDRIAFYVHDVVAGRIPDLGDRVRVDAIPNTDGGQYAWRLIRIQVDDSGPREAPAPAVATITQPGPQPGRHYATLRAVEVRPEQPRLAPNVAYASGERRSGFDMGPPPSMTSSGPPPTALPSRPAPLPTPRPAPLPATRPAPLPAPRPAPLPAQQRPAPLPAPKPAPLPAPKAADRRPPQLVKLPETHDSHRQRASAPSTYGRPSESSHYPSKQPAPERQAPPRVAPPPPLRVPPITSPSSRADDSQRHPRNRDRDRDAPDSSRRGGGRSTTAKRDREHADQDAARERDRAEREAARERDRERERPSQRESDKARDRAAPSRASASRSPPPARAAKYSAIKLPASPVYVRRRGLHDVAHRHKDLYIPSEFMQSVSHWLDMFQGPKRVRLNAHLKFNIHPAPKAVKDDSKAAARSSQRRSGDGGHEPTEGRQSVSKGGEAHASTAGAAATAPTPAAAAVAADAAAPEAEGAKAPNPAPDCAQEAHEGHAADAQPGEGIGAAATPMSVSDAGDDAGEGGPDVAAQGGGEPAAVDAPAALARVKVEVKVEDDAAAPMDVDPASEVPVGLPAAPGPAAEASTADAAECAPPRDERAAEGQRWSAKVLLMGGIPDDALRDKSGKAFVHPIQTPFLVGKRPRGELLLLGGQWQPCDGEAPAERPATLIQTAIRTVREAAGIDMAPCVEWIRLLDIQYRRSDSRGGPPGGAAVVEHTVVFLALAASVAAADIGAQAEIAAAQEAPQREAEAKAKVEEAERAVEAAEALVKALAEGPGAVGLQVADDEQPDPASLTVEQLQDELGKRSLDTASDPPNDKAVLQERLQVWLDANAAARREAAERVETIKAAAAALLQAKGTATARRDEHRACKEASLLGKKLLANPPAALHLECHPRSENDDLRCLTLDQLLDYSPNDTKETTFEVSMAAEAVMEMLQMHFGAVVANALQLIADTDVRAAAKAAEDSRRREERRRRDADKAEQDKARKDASADGGAVAVKVEDAAADRPNAGHSDATGPTPDKDVKSPGASGGSAARASECGSLWSPSGPTARTDKAETPRRESSLSGDRPSRKRKPDSLTGELSPSDAKKAKVDAAAKHTESVLLACRFFDDALNGFLEDKDVEDIVHLTQRFTTRRWVQHLVEAPCGRTRRLRYAEHPDLVAPFFPGLPVAEGVLECADDADGGAPGASSGVFSFDGVSMNVHALIAGKEMLGNELQTAKGKAADAERKAGELAARVAQLEQSLAAANAELDATRGKLAQAEAAAAESSAQLSKIVNEQQDMRKLFAQLNEKLSGGP